MTGLEPSEVELRRAARERALELLYEAEAKGVGVEGVLAELPLAPAPLAVELVRGVDAERSRIDEILARRVAPRWSLARLAAVDRAVLRLGTYELLGAPDRSQAVILNEAVVLARRFGTDDSPRFVNGVLSAVAAEVRPEGAAAVETSAEEPTPLVDALVIDLDGVIRHWDQESLTRVEGELGLPAGTVFATVFEPTLLDRAMRGALMAAEWAEEIGRAVAAAHGVEPGPVADAFAQAGWRIDESVMELVDQVRRRVPVALLSNASTRLVEDLRTSGIHERFDVVVGSAEIGAVKPEPEAFLAATERLGVPVERAMYVDDTAANVEAAAALGMRAVRFTDLDELNDALIEAGLLLA